MKITFISVVLHCISAGRGFLGGSDEKMRGMWLGQDIVVGILP